MKRTLYLIRHGETDHNAQNKFQGHLDIPLNENGRAQARELAKTLAALGVESPTAFVSSDLSRAYETAALLRENLPRAPLVVHKGLREAQLGEAQGLTFEEIESRFGLELLTQWRTWNLSDAIDLRYPGGESAREVTERIFKTLYELFAPPGHPELQDHSAIAVVTHGGAIRRFLYKVLPQGSPPRRVFNTACFKVDLYIKNGETCYSVLA